MLAFAFTKFDDIQLDILRGQGRLRQRLGNHEALMPLWTQLALQHRQHPRAVSPDIGNDILRFLSSKTAKVGPEWFCELDFMANTRTW